MDKYATRLRIVLLTGAAILLLFGWVIGPLAPEQDWGWVARNSGTFQRLAAAPASILALFEAVRARLEERRAVWTKDVQAQFDNILIELEDECLSLKIPAQMHRCGIAVWKLYELGRKERNAGERRRRLAVVAIRRVLRFGRTAGIKWREGMGVHGYALAHHKILAIDLDAENRRLYNCGEDTWNAQPEKVRRGLTYAEFMTASSGITDSDRPAGNFVVAVPVRWSGKALGVITLDTPPEMKDAAMNRRVHELLYAVGAYVLRPNPS